MKSIIIGVLLYIVVVCLFFGLVALFLVQYGPGMWGVVLEGTTEITKAITAGQLAR